MNGFVKANLIKEQLYKESFSYVPMIPLI